MICMKIRKYISNTRQLIFPETLSLMWFYTSAVTFSFQSIYLYHTPNKRSASHICQTNYNNNVNNNNINVL